MQVRELLGVLDNIAPLSIKESYDNVGLIVGSEDMEVTGILLALDLTLEVLDEAIAKSANVILTHHPIIFEGLKNINTSSNQGKIIQKLIKEDMCAIAMHTNMDKAIGGLNDYLCEIANIKNTKILEKDINAQYGFGRYGELEKEMTVREYCLFLEEVLHENIRFVGSPSRTIRTVAVCSGAGSGMFEIASKLGLDAFITGDIKHNVAIDAKFSKTALIDAGHFGSEAIFKNIMARHLQNSFDRLQWKIDVMNSQVEKSPWSYV